MKRVLLCPAANVSRQIQSQPMAALSSFRRKLIKVGHLRHSAYDALKRGALASLLCAMAIMPASAANRWWDGGTIDISGNGNGASLGGAGTWDTTIKNWDQGNGIAYAAWNNAA